MPLNPFHTIFTFPGYLIFLPSVFHSATQFRNLALFCGCFALLSLISFGDNSPSNLETMPQGYAIELYFDPALENQVLKAWNMLARRQISTQLIEIESRPHLTLFSSPYVDTSKLESILRNFATKQEPLSICFSSIGTLPNYNVLFLGPTPSLSLLQFHSQLCDAMKKEGIEIGDEHLPNTWVPHCPVAEEVPRTRMAEAFTILRDLKMPVSGYAVEISLVEYPPVRELSSFTLGTHQISEV